jgi:hypothetical protein
LLVNNTTAVSVTITQRFDTAGTTEAGSPDTDPGYALATGASITLPFSQPIWFATASSTGNLSVTPFA